MKDLKENLRQLLIEEIKIQEIPPAEINATPLSGDNPGLDLLEAMGLFVLIQKHFSLQIADMDEGSEPFASIGSLARSIETRKEIRTVH